MRPMIIFCAVIFLASSSYAQKLLKVGEFSSYEQDVQFLPGGFVFIHNDIADSKTKVYKFQSRRFVRLRSELPHALEHWSSFNWHSIDSFDQIDLGFFVNDSIKSFLPAGSKVKALTTVPGMEPNRLVKVICYAVPAEKERESGLQGLHLLLVSRDPGPEFTHTAYKKITDIVAQEDSIFGTILVERQPAGTFVVLYSASGGSHLADELAVFLVEPKASKTKKGNRQQATGNSKSKRF